jgi:hypothetical protein
MQDYFSLMRRATMLPQVNTLPRAQAQPPLHNRDGNIDPGQSRSNMSRHVILPFHRVHKHGITVPNKVTEKGFKIATNIRVGVLLDQQRSRSVPDLQRNQSVLELVLRNPAGDCIGEFVETTTSRLDSNFV